MKQWLKAAAIGMMITAVLVCSVFPAAVNAFSVELTTPLSFGGEGTQTVNLSRAYPSRTFRLIVNESGVYQIAAETAQRIYLELFDEGNNSLMVADADRYGEIAHMTVQLEADTAYLIYTTAHDILSKGAMSYPLSVYKATAAANGELFKNDGISVRCGDIIDPVFLEGTPSGITLTSSDPGNMYIDENGCAVTVQSGNVELIATDKNGVTDRMAVEIKSRRSAMALEDANPQFHVGYGTLSEDVAFYAFGVAVVEHEPVSVTVFSQGSCDLAAMLCDEYGNVLDQTAANARGNFRLSASGSKPDVFYVYVRVNNVTTQDDSFEIGATIGTPVTEAQTLRVYDNAFIHESSGCYTVYCGQEVHVTDADDYIVPDSFTDNGNGRFVPTATGVYTLSAGEQAVQLTVIDYVQGDLTLDGVANMRDALMLYQVSGGRTTVDETTTAFAELTGDNAVNMRDALKLYQIVSGVNGDNGGNTESDPIPGDETDDEW